MKTILKKLSSNRIFLTMAAFSVPLLVMLSGALALHIKPFGENGFLVSDIDSQFAAFFTYWRDSVLSGTGGLKYSLAKTLGGDMTGFCGYYLNNPFLFMLFLFKAQDIAVGIYYMLAIMISFMGLTFQLMLDGKYGCSYKHLMLSWGYALSGYSMAFLITPFYLCSLILLPVIIMGLDTMMGWHEVPRESDNEVHRKSEKRNDVRGAVTYIISLGMCIWCNYYIGYMICIFTGMYFVAGMIGRYERNAPEGKPLLRSICAFALASIAGVLLSAPELIAVIKSLSGEKTSDISVIFDTSLMYRPGLFVFNLLPGQFRCDFTNGAAPYVYTGLAVLACVILFLFSSGISLRKKLTGIAFLALLVLSTWISGLDSVWHGLNQPVGFSHRQAFTIVFLLLLLGAEGLEHTDFKRLGVHFSYIVPIALVILQAADLSFNAISAFKAYGLYEMGSQTEYEEYYIKNRSMIDGIEASDDSLYRIEKDYSRNHNDAMMLGYNGLSHNSSCEKEFVKIFMARMGFRNQGIWASYRNGSTSFTDSMLGVKYYISRFDSTNKPYESDFSCEGSYVYKNPYALQLAWTDTMEHVSSVDLKTQDLFEIQDQMAGSAIYTPLNASESLTGLNAVTLNTGASGILNGSTDDIVGVKNTGSGLCARIPEEYTSYEADDTDTHFIEYTMTIDSECNLYCYFAAAKEQDAKLYINDTLWDDYFSDYRWGIVNCGNFLSGDEVKIKLETSQAGLDLYDAYFYEEHTDELEKWYERMQDDGVAMEKVNSSEYTVSRLNAENSTQDGKSNDLVVFSIPYEENWEFEIDGVKVSPVMVYDCLMAVPVPNNWSSIELKYRQ